MSEEEEEMNPVSRVYLGDGVYAINEGYGITLLTSDIFNPTDRIFLEPEVFKNLVHFKERGWV